MQGPKQRGDINNIDRGIGVFDGRKECGVEVCLGVHVFEAWNEIRGRRQSTHEGRMARCA